MNLFNKIISLALSISVYSIPQTPLRMEWGLKNTDFYQKDSDSSREFMRNTNGHDNDKNCSSRHYELWNTYRREHRNLNKKEFREFERTQDPFCVGVANDHTPSFYFNFIGSPNDEYILQTITVETLNYDGGFAGGAGFIADRAGYELTLSHIKGRKDYPVGDKLVFKGHGQAVLRLRHDPIDEIPANGWEFHSALYKIKVTFNFSVNGQTETNVSTEPFSIRF